MPIRGRDLFQGFFQFLVAAAHDHDLGRLFDRQQAAKHGFDRADAKAAAQLQQDRPIADQALLRQTPARSAGSAKTG